MDDENTNAACQLLFDQKHGVLSTHSVDLPGFPFGSVTPYSLNYLGNPTLLISSLAQHTKNIINNPKVSLTILEPTKQDVQAVSRLTYVAEAIKISNNLTSISERYYRYFPTSQGYHEIHDFDFYELIPVKARFIGGFGKIGWIKPQQLIKPNPFDAKMEKGILEHMNQDHQKAMHHYFSIFKNNEISESISMVGIDELGFDLMVNDFIYRFTFEFPIKTIDEARKALVKMAHE